MKYLTVYNDVEKEFEAPRPSIAACKSFTYFSKKNVLNEELKILVFTIGLKKSKTYSVFVAPAKNPFYLKRPISKLIKY